ncbi:MAG: glucose-1-phosphate thymidylyltransferase [Thermotoga sp.]|nr:MAG: glucose-1-phosphate thymidylyltransferase [Thermotoga sp.]
MKAIVLCAGKGTRLRPLTHTSAKHLIPIANKPVLTYSLEAIKRAGIDEIGLIVNSYNIEDFKKEYGNGEALGLKIEYILQKEPKGLAHAVSISRDFLKDESFLMYLGDNLLEEDLKGFVDEFLNNGFDASILLAPVKNPSRFGIATLSRGKVMRVVEKPKEPESNLALIGIYLFTSRIFEGIKNIKPSWRGELEITDAIEYMIEQGYNVTAQVVYGWWKDTGAPEDIIEANRRVLIGIKEGFITGTVDEKSRLEGTVSVGEGSQIISSVIRGPVIIGKKSTIENCYVGPFTSIGDSVILNNCEVENSILLKDSHISDVMMRIDASLIGRNVRIRGSHSRPSSLRVVLGDYSQTEIHLTS